jgi:beta-lactamase superfamily II metal-dependent hydrolase
MNCDGIEVDMLNLGNADSILVTRWSAGVASRILIDGGNTSDAETVLNFLRNRGIKYIDHIVCSHPHDDHAGGLLGIVKSPNIDFGQAWVHLPWRHIDQNALIANLNKSESTASRVVKIVRASVQSAQELVAAIDARGKLIGEPFQGVAIGFLFVCGPSKEYYEQLLKDFADYEKLKVIEKSMSDYEMQSFVESVFEATTYANAAESGLGKAPTEPENNSSTILYANHGGDGLLFTADAGVEALTLVSQAYNLASLRWMQVPHHGSRRNVNEDLIGYFKPRTAYISADGTKKHPRRAVVNAFKAVGTEVFSTHYPLPNGCNKWFHVGAVPSRSDYSAAVSLYNAD